MLRLTKPGLSLGVLHLFCNIPKIGDGEATKRTCPVVRKTNVLPPGYIKFFFLRFGTCASFAIQADLLLEWLLSAVKK